MKKVRFIAEALLLILILLFAANKIHNNRLICSFPDNISDNGIISEIRIIQPYISTGNDDKIEKPNENKQKEILEIISSQKYKQDRNNNGFNNKSDEAKIMYIDYYEHKEEMGNKLPKTMILCNDLEYIGIVDYDADNEHTMYIPQNVSGKDMFLEIYKVLYNE